MTSLVRGLMPGLVVRRQFQHADVRRRELSERGRSDQSIWQLAAVARVWADAVADVPYYAELVAAGAAPAAIRSWADLRSLPVLTRQLLQDQPRQFVRRSAPPHAFMRTAGSTGTPLQIGMNQTERDLMRVVKLVEWQASGYGPGCRLFLIWGHAHLLGTGWRRTVNHAKRKLADRFLGYRRVDAYRLSRDRCEAYAESLIRHRPVGVIGYASALDLFARYTGRFRDRFRALGVRFVLTTAEAPPRPDSVALLEDLFGCQLVQEYGGAEFGQVAFKRGLDPFAVYGDLNFVEGEEAGAENHEERSLLLTSLYPRYLPLIRYRVGDAVIGAQCESHGHVTRFDAVGGRVNDVVMLTSTDAVHSVAVFHCVHQEDAVYNIQMVLDDAGIDIVLVTGPTDRGAMESRIRARLAQVHPLLGQARIVYVDDLQTGRAGKRRWFVDRRTSPPCAESPAS
jgi:phenylacetate-coenzyme A ligase PaaK-like adenylate-forming protein